MSYEVAILSNISKDIVFGLADSVRKMSGKTKMHAFAETKDIYAAFEKILEISKNCEGILFVDEMAKPKPEVFSLCEKENYPMRFSMHINDDCSIQLCTFLPSSIIQGLSAGEFYGIIWGKGELIEKYDVRTFDNMGMSHNFKDSKLSYFFGSKLKYFISIFGDEEDIEIIDNLVKSFYFSASEPEYIVGINEFYNKYFDATCRRLNMKKESFAISYPYPPYGKGLIFVPVRDMKDCFSVRFFADSIKNQTYKNFDVIMFGKEEDLKDISSYYIHNAKFIVTEKADYDFINRELRVSHNYEWFCVLDHYSRYDKDTIQMLISSGNSVCSILSSKCRVEDMVVVSEVAVDRNTLFFNREALNSVGYFDPINYFGAAEYMNRCSSLNYSKFKIIPAQKAINIDIELNFAIDKRKILRDNYFGSLKGGYAINPATSGYSTITDVPLEMTSRKIPVSKGEIFVSEIIVRTLSSKSRFESIVSQLKERNVGSVRVFNNTHKDDPKIKELYDKGMVYTGPNCYQCGKTDCSHQKKLTSGQVANFYSMMSLFKEIAANDDYDESLYMIMEDDVRLSNNFVEVINQKILDDEVLENISSPLLLRVGWGNMLEYRRDHYLEKLENYEWRESFKRFANPCFIVNKHAVKKYVKEFKTYDRACDQWVHTELGMEIKNFSLYPPLCDELSHIGLIESEMHPKASSYEYQYLQFVKTGNIQHYNESVRLKKEYDDFWRDNGKIH